MISVAVVANNENPRHFLCQSINSSSDCRCVCVCGTVRQALLEIPLRQPAVALIEADLRNESGIAWIEDLARILPKMAIIMVSSEMNGDQFFPALTSGACGYLLLDESNQNDLLRAIAEAASGGAPLSGLVARRLIDKFRQSGMASNDLAALSPRELEVLGHLSAGMSNKQLALQLNISYETACVHLRRIYRKLRVRSRTEALLKYIQAQQAPIRGQEVKANLFSKPAERLSFLLAENLKLAEKLDRNCREIIDIRASERVQSKRRSVKAALPKESHQPIPVPTPWTAPTICAMPMLSDASSPG